MELPETCRVVISITLEFSASVGFIHKESVAVVSQRELGFVICISLYFIKCICWLEY